MINKKVLSQAFELITYIVCIVAITGTISYGVFGYLLSSVILIILFTILVIKINYKFDLTVNLLFPIMLSVTQNMYLGFFSPNLTAFQIQFLVILNFIYSFIMAILLLISKAKWKLKNNFLKIVLICVSIILFYCLLIAIIKRGNFISMFSSFRNIISIYLYFLIGILAYKNAKTNNFYYIILLISIFVIAVGFIDIFTNGQLWLNLNITDLWTKKGIRLQPSGLPTNFYSSEKINGVRLRRMTSTFADPVNLGSFLTVIFFLSWYLKKKIILILSILAICFTVSKGALVGILIFLCVYSYYHNSKPFFIIILTLTSIIGLFFLIYAARTSANSVFLHISGFISAFKHMLTNPIGDGLGSNGVLAKQFSGFTTNSEITESGLGMIIGQIGIIGLFIFFIFFKKIILKINKIKNQRDKILMFSLTYSLIFNICFNEVALSPNSCAIYMIILGLNLGKINQKKDGVVW